MSGRQAMVVSQTTTAIVMDIQRVFIPSLLAVSVITDCPPTTLNCVLPLWLSLSMVEHIENGKKIKW